jgi:tetratricopeptide (TPR) repeat protein
MFKQVLNLGQELGRVAMPLHRAALLLLVALPFAPPAPAADSSWVGKFALFRDVGKHVYGPCDPKGQLLPQHESSALDVVVVKQQGDWVRIREGDVEGWLRKESLVPADEAIAYFGDLVARATTDGERAQGYNGRGCAYRHLGRFDEALKDLDRLVELTSDQPFGYYNRGTLRMQAKRYPGALSDLENAIRLYGDTQANWCSGAHTRCAWMRQEQGDFERALAEYTRALQLSPQSSSARFGRARLWRLRGEPDKGGPDLDQALKDDPKDSTAYSERGLLRMRHKDYAAARADIDQATRYAYLLTPYTFQAPLVRLNCAWFLATCPEEKYRDGARAVLLARKGCELTYWKDGDCLDALAAACAEASQFREAAEWEGKALAQTDFERRHGAEARDRLRLYRDGKPFRQ